MTSKYLCVIIISCLAAVVSGQRGDAGPVRSDERSPCAKGYWGDQCQNVCGYCALKRTIDGPYDRECNSETGLCEIGCQGGWRGLGCDEAICDSGCNGGECVYPGVCANCGDRSLVAPGCQSLRLRGLIGAGISLAVLTLCLMLCGFFSAMYQKRKSKKTGEEDEEK